VTPWPSARHALHLQDASVAATGLKVVTRVTSAHLIVRILRQVRAEDAVVGRPAHRAGLGAKTQHIIVGQPLPGPQCANGPAVAAALDELDARGRAYSAAEPPEVCITLRRVRLIAARPR
jgi:hypothetical protein